jgi:hypothetical protein
MMSSRSRNLWEWAFRPVVAALWGILAVIALVWYWFGWHVTHNLSGTFRDEAFLLHVGASVLFVATITLALARMWAVGRRRDVFGILVVVAAAGTYALFAFASAIVDEASDKSSWGDRLGLALLGGIMVALAFLTAMAVLMSWASDSAQRIADLRLSRHEGSRTHLPPGRGPE